MQNLPAFLLLLLAWTGLTALRAGEQPGGEPAAGPAAAEPTRIERIEFKGLVTVPESRLRMLLRTHEGDIYDEDTIRADKKRIQSLNIFNEAKPYKIIETVAGVPRLVLQYQCEEFPLIEGIEFIRMVRPTDAEGNPTGPGQPDPLNPHELVMTKQKLWDAIRTRPVAPELEPDGYRERRLALFNAIALETRTAWQAGSNLRTGSPGMPPDRYRSLSLDNYLSSEADASAGPRENTSALSIRDGAFEKAATREPELNEGQRGMDTVGRLFLGRVNLDAQQIEKIYAADGYSHVKVAYQVTPVTVGPDGKPLLVHLIFQVFESDRIYPAEVVFSGTTVLPDAALLASIRSRPMLLLPPIFMEDKAAPVQAEVLKADRHDVEAFIRRQGYMNAEVGAPEITVDRSLPARRGLGTRANWYEARLTFPVRKAGERDRHYTGRITILGNQAVSSEEIREVMEIQPAGPFSQELQDTDERAIEELYQSRGRLATQATIEEIPIPAGDPRLKEAADNYIPVVISDDMSNLHDLVIHINEGPEVSVGQIFVKGNTETRDDVVYRELRLTPGMRYNSRLKEASVQRLQNTQLFSRVVITPIPTATNDPLVRDLEVTVQEAQTTGSLVLGFGFSSVDRFFANLTFDQKNFDIADLPQSWRDLGRRPPFIRSLKGGGQDFNVQLQVGGRSSSASVTFVEPWFTGRPIGFTTNLAITRTNQVNYDEEVARFAMGLDRRFGDFSTWSLGGKYSIEQITIANIDTDAPLGIKEVGGRNLISRFTTSLSYDTRDLRAFPTSGNYLEWQVQNAGGVLGGDFDFVKGSFRGTHYMTLYENADELRHTVLFSLELGRVTPYGRSNFVPVFDRFFAGSIGSVRGFQRRSISPRDGGDVVGGENILTFSVQYSFPLLAESDPTLLIGARPKKQRSYFNAYQREFVRGIVFLDGGTVTEPSSRATTAAGFTTERDMRMSVGFGIMLRVPQLPVPLKIYYARTIRQASEDDTERIQLDLSAFFGR